ncbi:MAG: DUF4332 domain-containing protein [Geminicoccaceae bacterium]|nr:DUF4332 domain-containing protein [Geminicoccaceae bacterium]
MAQDPSRSDWPAWSLPISKLRGVPQTARVRLKSRRITNCGQLLAAAAVAERRQSLARATGIDPLVLEAVVRRADMSRVNGIGAVFGMMLEELDILDVGALARQDPARLHGSLRDYNRQERIARRSPTPEEVEDWVRQARALPQVVTCPEEEPSS